ncbi:MAG: hypothetical protein HYW15_03265 [Candidatus Giovannonibacteria bacterium]|nr:MAG: hypothetical protein HYW15_03265 [Candidatus Giovannonibacteria bacterium]
MPQLIVPIGNISEEKAEKYLSFCQEKAKRLAQHAEHLSSWESRCPDQNRWGGAVRVGDFIFSMSGFPELGDEAIMLATAGIYYKGWQSPKAIDTINIIAERSQNPYWSNLLAFLSRWI